MLILTYFYGKFTAKNWKFTTKLDFFRKKTIPTRSPAIKNAVGFVYPRDVIGSFTPTLANDVPDKLLHGIYGAVDAPYWGVSGMLCTHVAANRRFCHTQNSKDALLHARQRTFRVGAQTKENDDAHPTCQSSTNTTPSPAPCRLPSSTTQLKLNPRVFNQTHINLPSP